MKQVQNGNLKINSKVIIRRKNCEKELSILESVRNFKNTNNKHPNYKFSYDIANNKYK